MLDESLFRQIIDAWNADQAHPLRQRPQRPAPDLATVRAVVDTVFLTSLRKEEGRPILPSVAVLDPALTGEREVVGNCLVMPLASRAPLIVSVLEKLSPAIDPDTSALAVMPASPTNTDPPAVWAILAFGESLPSFGRPSVHNQFFLGRADLLTVRAEAPGSLLIARGTARLGSLVADTFVRATPTPFIERGLGRFVMAAIEQNEGNVDNAYWLAFRDSMLSLLEQLSVRTHGAALVFLPMRQVEAACPFFQPRYGLTSDLRIHDVLRAMLARGAQRSHEGELLRVNNGLQLYERLNTLAQLAAIDGALVVSSSFEVLGFGATLEAPHPWAGRVLTGPDGFGGGGEPFDMSMRGTRHNSAVNFVGRAPVASRSSSRRTARSGRSLSGTRTQSSAGPTVGSRCSCSAPRPCASALMTKLRNLRARHDIRV